MSLDQDPRPLPGDMPPDVDVGEALRPAVAGPARRAGLGLLIGVPALLGLVVLLVMNGQRHRAVRDLEGETPTAGGALVASAPPPSELALVEAQGRGSPYAPPAPPSAVPPPPAAVIPTPAPVAPSQALANPAQQAAEAAARAKAPALVVDLAGGDAPASAAGTGPTMATAAAKPLTPVTGPGALSGDEAFAQRTEAAEPERARATMLRNQSATIAQGAMIPAVLETALNSDLPGYARAVVSRDIRGFDGSTVLIPRGTRVIGQYKSAVAQGASRAFVIWTRLLRPDGGSIQIGSPVTDPLGRAGLEGKVDRHFLERFGGAILLSVLNAGVQSLANQPSTQVVIGSSSQATSLAGSAFSPDAIAPTIRVAQGAPIRIFVARDLDFSAIQPAGAGAGPKAP